MQYNNMQYNNIAYTLSAEAAEAVRRPEFQNRGAPQNYQKSWGSSVPPVLEFGSGQRSRRRKQPLPQRNRAHGVRTASSYPPPPPPPFLPRRFPPRF
eukprot:SAG31_NODE_39021_length_291_cov_1.078125_1_plen_96_part_11